MGLLVVPVLAALIYTAPLEEVVARSSHVALASWQAEAKRFRVERWYRGAWPADRINVHGIPDFVGRECRKVPRVILFLEEVDGRLYLSGLRRYGKGSGAHASVRLVNDQGAVLAFSQRMNPGWPEPHPVSAKTLSEYEAVVKRALEAHPFQPQPGNRPALPPKYRDAFFEAVGGVFDWYQGRVPVEMPGWGRSKPRGDVLEAAAGRLAKWMESVPEEHRIHALDGMMILCRDVQGGGPDITPIFERVRSGVGKLDPEQAEAWILRELQFGDYYVNRVAFGLLAREVGPVTYERALVELEGWVERQAHNEGSDSWFALVRLGHRDRAEAAAARREARQSPLANK